MGGVMFFLLISKYHKVAQYSCICSLSNLADASINEIVLLTSCQMTNDIYKKKLDKLEHIYTSPIPVSWKYDCHLVGQRSSIRLSRMTSESVWKVSVLCHHQSSPICINGSLSCVIWSMWSALISSTCTSDCERTCITPYQNIVLLLKFIHSSRCMFTRQDYVIMYLTIPCIRLLDVIVS